MSSQTPTNPPSLSEAEWEVMKVFWQHSKPMAARDVDAAISGSRDWSIKTVKTLLSRLVAKGALSYQAVGNSYQYEAVVSREIVTREEVRGFVDRVLDGADSTLLAHFIERTQLNDDEIEKLQAILDNKQSHKKGKEKR